MKYIIAANIIKSVLAQARESSGSSVDRSDEEQNANSRRQSDALSGLTEAVSSSSCHFQLLAKLEARYYEVLRLVSRL